MIVASMGWPTKSGAFAAVFIRSDVVLRAASLLAEQRLSLTHPQIPAWIPYSSVTKAANIAHAIEVDIAYRKLAKMQNAFGSSCTMTWMPLTKPKAFARQDVSLDGPSLTAISQGRSSAGIVFPLI